MSEPPDPIFLASALRVSRLLSEHLDVAVAVESRLQHALECARDIILRNRAAVEALAAALVEREVLSGNEALKIVEGARVNLAPSMVVR